MCIPHAGPTIPSSWRHILRSNVRYNLCVAYFFTFITTGGHAVSLTSAHFIIAVARTETRMKIIRASQVTLQHRLIIADRTVSLKKITYAERIGYYSPITLSGYLAVNNLSTSVYVDWWVARFWSLSCLPILFIRFSLHASHEFFHRVAGPFRVYYRTTRWFFGNNYVPFATATDNELHPISIFLIANFESIRLFFISFPLLMPIMFIASVIYLAHRISLSRKNKYRLMLKYMEQWCSDDWRNVC